MSLSIRVLLLLCIGFAIFARAEGEAPYAQTKGFIDGTDENWASKGYPANISYAYESGGEVLEDGTSVVWWEIGIVNADAGSERTVTDMLPSNSRITFFDCKYTHEQRTEAYYAILAMKDDKIHDVLFVSNSEKIQVVVSTDRVADYSEALKARFGDMIYVSDESGTADAEGNGT